MVASCRANCHAEVLDVSDGLKTFCGQKLDHFAKNDDRTWCQRYTTNRTYWKAGGPVFVCIDGEDYPWGGSRKPYTLMCNNMMEFLALIDRHKPLLSGPCFDVPMGKFLRDSWFKLRTPSCRQLFLLCQKGALSSNPRGLSGAAFP